MVLIRTVPKPAAGAFGQPERIYYGTYDRIILDHVDWRCEESDDYGHLLWAAHDKRIRRTITHKQMKEEAERAGFQHDRNWYDKTAMKMRMRVEAHSLNELKYEYRQTCFWKEDFVRELEKLQALDKAVTLGDDPLAEAIKVIDQELRRKTSAILDDGRRRRGGRRKEYFDPPGVKALREWRNLYIESDRDPLCFRPQYHNCGNRDDRMTDEQTPLLRKFARKFPAMKKPSVNGLLTKMKEEIADLNERRPADNQIRDPSWGRLNKEIQAIGAFETEAGREGMDAAMKEYRHIGEGMKDVVRPLQHVEIDHWTVQLHTILVWSGAWEKLNHAQRRRLRKVRMIVGIAICRLTRVVLGMILTEKATVEATIRLVEMAVSDKRSFGEASGARTPYDIRGTGETFFHDGGPALNNLPVRTIFRDLRVGFLIAPAGLAHLRGTVERMFRGIDQELLVWFEGRTFGSTAAKGDYDSQKATGTTTDELGRALVRFAVDCHHNKVRKALGYRTPRQFYLELTMKRGVNPSPDPSKQRNVFGTDYKRTLSAGGIRFLGIQYRSRELHKQFMAKKNAEYTCRIHHANLGAISVKIGKSLLTVKGPQEFDKVDAETWIGAEELLRKQGARMEKMTAQLRHAAIKEFDEMSETARKRADISHEPITKKQVLAAEHRIMTFASFPEDEMEEELSGDLYDDAIDVPPPRRAAAKPPRAAGKARAATGPQPAKAKASKRKASGGARKPATRPDRQAHRRQAGPRGTWNVKG